MVSRTCQRCEEQRSRNSPASRSLATGHEQESETQGRVRRGRLLRTRSSGAAVLRFTSVAHSTAKAPHLRYWRETARHKPTRAPTAPSPPRPPRCRWPSGHWHLHSSAELGLRCTQRALGHTASAVRPARAFQLGQQPRMTMCSWAVGVCSAPVARATAPAGQARALRRSGLAPASHNRTARRCIL